MTDCVSAGVVSVPAFAIASVNPLLPRHVLTLVVTQSSFAVFPDSNSASEEVKDSVGAFHPVTAALPFALPPRPVQVNENVESSLVMLADCVPELPREPVQSPAAEQPSALVDDHVSANVPPIRASAAAAEKVMVGAGGGPPPPPQLTSNPVREMRTIRYDLRMSAQYWSSVRDQTGVSAKADSRQRRS